MQSSFDAICDGARKLAPYLKSTFPLYDIRAARRKLRLSVTSCLDISGGDKEQAERLMNSALLSDKTLQTAANRVLVGILLNSLKQNPRLSRDPFKEMVLDVDLLHSLILRTLSNHQLIETRDSEQIFKQLLKTKNSIKEVRKAVV